VENGKKKASDLRFFNRIYFGNNFSPCDVCLITTASGSGNQTVSAMSEH